MVNRKNLECAERAACHLLQARCTIKSSSRCHVRRWITENGSRHSFRVVAGQACLDSECQRWRIAWRCHRLVLKYGVNFYRKWPFMIEFQAFERDPLNLLLDPRPISGQASEAFDPSGAPPRCFHNFSRNNREIIARNASSGLELEWTSLCCRCYPFL